MVRKLTREEIDKKISETNEVVLSEEDKKQLALSEEEEDYWIDLFMLNPDEFEQEVVKLPLKKRAYVLEEMLVIYFPRSSS